ncbi:MULTISPECIES: cupin domain-containing protein [unclassified Streptomyces]|uniref:cupin domain-containing protein n=1 Tax=unclassified Streptomyces TaxID=2593676 RepID=UPI003249FD97
MKILDIDTIIGSQTTAYGSQGVRRVRVHGGSGSAAVNIMHLAPGGRLGRHVAPVPQVLIVTEGQGWASGTDGEPEALMRGQAACWAAGEEHETWTDTGMTVLIVEAQSPAQESMLGEAGRG